MEISQLSRIKMSTLRFVTLSLKCKGSVTATYRSTAIAMTVQMPLTKEAPPPMLNRAFNHSGTVLFRYIKYCTQALLQPIRSPNKRSLKAKLAVRKVVGVRRHRSGSHKMVTSKRRFPQTVSADNMKSMVVKVRRNEELELASDIGLKVY